FFSLSSDTFDPKKVSDNDDRIRMESNNDGASQNSPSSLICIKQIFFAWDLVGGGYPQEHIMWLHLGTKSCLRYEPNPYLQGMRPFIKLTFVEKEGEFDGEGIGEMCEQYQEEVTTIHNQRGDN